jgi:hypothetical protein
MWPTPIDVYTCPACKKANVRGGSLSFPALFNLWFSDGYCLTFNNMQRIYTLCDICSNVFPMNDANLEMTVECFDSKYPNYLELKETESKKVCLEDLIDVSKNSQTLSKEDEVQLRLEIHWTFNDRVRYAEKIEEVHPENYMNTLCQSDFETEVYSLNQERLIALMPSETDQAKILLADVHRTAGNFKECAEIINQIVDPCLLSVKAAYSQACDMRYKGVFILPPLDNVRSDDDQPLEENKTN